MLILFFILNLLNAETLVTINNKEITKKDLEKFNNDYHQGKFYLSPTLELNKGVISLNELINLELAKLDLERAGYKETEEAKKIAEIAITNQYLYKNVYKKVQDMPISDKDISNHYKKAPVMKIFRLSIPYNPSSSDGYKKAYALLTTIRADLVKGRITAQEALKRTNVYGNEKYNGIFDKIYWDELMPEQKNELTNLEVGSYSSLIDSVGMIEFLQIVSKYSFSNEFTHKIKQFIMIERTITEKDNFFKKLRIKYKDLVKTKI
jgi:hypothetical protein